MLRAVRKSVNNKYKTTNNKNDMKTKKRNRCCGSNSFVIVGAVIVKF